MERSRTRGVAARRWWRERCSWPRWARAQSHRPWPRTSQTSGWESLGDVTLRLAGESSSEATLTTLAEQFMEQYPNVTVDSRSRTGTAFMGTVLNIADSTTPRTSSSATRATRSTGRSSRPASSSRSIRTTRPTAGTTGTATAPRPSSASPRTAWTSARVRSGASPSRPTSWASTTTSTSSRPSVCEPPGTFAELRGRAGGCQGGRRAAHQAGQPGGLARHPRARHRRRARPGPRPTQRAWVFGEDGADFAAAGNLAGGDDVQGLGRPGLHQRRRERPRLRPGLAGVRARATACSCPGAAGSPPGLRDAMGDDKVGFIAPPAGESGKVASRGRALAAVPHLQQVRRTRTSPPRFIDFVMNPDKGQVYFDNGRIPASAGSVGLAGRRADAAGGRGLGPRSPLMTA